MNSYPDLIKAELFEKEWVPQDGLLSSIARKKHGISKAGDKKKGAVLISLKSMYKQGILKKAVDEDGNIFWGKKMPGDDSLVLWNKTAIKADPFELMKLHTARKNIKDLEEQLRKICSEVLKNAYGSDWEKHIDPKTREIIASQHWKERRSPWTPGGSADDFLSVAGIKDISHIIGGDNWEVFRPKFGIKNKIVVLGKISELGDYRNRIQHNSDLSKDEYLFFNIAAQLFIRDLG